MLKSKDYLEALHEATTRLGNAVEGLQDLQQLLEMRGMHDSHDYEQLDSIHTVCAL